MAGQATMLTHRAQKVGGRLPCPVVSAADGLPSVILARRMTKFEAKFSNVLSHKYK